MCSTSRKEKPERQSKRAKEVRARVEELRRVRRQQVLREARELVLQVLLLPTPLQREQLVGETSPRSKRQSSRLSK